MEILNRLHDRVDVLELFGAATTDGHEQLRRTVRRALDCGRNLFVINLMHAEALDSLMLGEAVACLKRARERGGDVKIVVAPGGNVHEILQLVGFERVFEIYGDEAEALASFRLEPSG